MGAIPSPKTQFEVEQEQCSIGRELVNLGKTLLATRQDTPSIRSTRDATFNLYDRLSKLLSDELLQRHDCEGIEHHHV